MREWGVWSLGATGAVTGGGLGRSDRRTRSRIPTTCAGPYGGTGPGRGAGDRPGLWGGRLGRHPRLARCAHVSGRGGVMMTWGRSRRGRVPDTVRPPVVLGLGSVLRRCAGMRRALRLVGSGCLSTHGLLGVRGGRTAPAGLGPGDRAGAGCLGTGILARALLGLHPVSHPAYDRGFDGRGRRTDELSHVIQLRKKFFAFESELFGKLVDADLGHYSPSGPGLGQDQLVVGCAHCLVLIE